MKLKITLNDKDIFIPLEEPELMYGIEGVKYSEETDAIEAYIEAIDKKVPVIHSTNNGFLIPAHNKEDYNYAKENNLKITQVVSPYFYGEGEEKIREDKPTQKRHSVIAVIKHPEKEEYLCLDCKKRNCKSFVLGGIEQGESVADAAIREIKEETGYTDVLIENQSDFKLINHFYAGYKGVNRYATLDIIFGTLKSETNIGIVPEENEKHTVKWIPKDDLKNFISVNNNQFVVDMILNGETAYIGDGIMINSNELNGMTRDMARQELAKS